MYCVKCRNKTDTTDLQNTESKNGRPMLRGKCVICGTTKTQFISMNCCEATGGDLVSSLNSITSKFKLPWAKYPGEMHLPGMNFAGPGTRLDLRLNPDGTPKESSKPIDRVDAAAYRHDMAYDAFPDTKTRNIADRVMVSELNEIPNPTLRERVERAVIKPILSTKANFGLGLLNEQQLAAIYYSPHGYWRGQAAVKKLAVAAQVSAAVAHDWLGKQAIWQIYLPPPRKIIRPHFNETKPNAIHQADLLYLPHDKIIYNDDDEIIYKYALTVVDVASRYKEAEPLTDKSAPEVAAALGRIYKRGPLTWPRLLQVDPGREFMGGVKKLLAKHKVDVRRGEAGNHRQQGIVERFNRTLAERLFGAQYAQELLLAARGSSERSSEWVRALPKVIAALNNEKTRMIGMKPVDAIKLTDVIQLQNKVGLKDPVNATVPVRYLYAPGEIEGGERRRATDPIWSLKVYEIDRVERREGSPALYYLRDGPARSFLREELLVVPEDTELPPSSVLNKKMPS